jgi:hypothetical protein
MLRRRVLPVPLALTLLFLGLAPLGVLAQDATPGPAPSGPGGTVVASGLTNPRGFVWGPDGALYVALAGSGGTTLATEQTPSSQILGPFHGGPSGAVARIDNGCPVAVATGLPSTIDAMGEILGAEDVAFLGGTMYIAADGGGPSHGNPDQPAGIYTVGSDGTVSVLADLSAWLRANPVATTPPDYDPDADGYRMVADESIGALWVLEPNSGGVLKVTPDGTVSRVADLSADHPVPSAIALVPGGGAVYIGNLTAVPFPDGAAKVIKVMADGTVSDVWTGLTVVTGLAVGPDGSLYASEMSTGNLTEPPFLTFGTGKVVKMTGPDSSEEVATGLMLPIALGIGPDGALYVASPAIGANGGEGVIIRLDVVGMGTPSAGAAAGSPTPCTPVPGTTGPAMIPASPEASPVA